MPAIITCPACDAQLSVPTANEVYGESNPFEGEDAQHPVVDVKLTGRQCHFSELYFCPLHTAIIGDFKEAERQDQAWLLETLQAAEAAFLRADPTPTLTGYLQWRKQA